MRAAHTVAEQSRYYLKQIPRTIVLSQKLGRSCHGIAGRSSTYKTQIPRKDRYKRTEKGFLVVLSLTVKPQFQTFTESARTGVQLLQYLRRN